MALTRRPAILVGAFAAVLVLSARPAHAYLDPAAGSMMLQLLLGGLAGLGIAVKLMWRRIMALLGRGAKQPREAADPLERETPRGV